MRISVEDVGELCAEGAREVVQGEKGKLYKATVLLAKAPGNGPQTILEALQKANVRGSGSP